MQVSYSQVGIGTLTPDNSAILDVHSTNKGFLPPRLTTAQRNAISSPSMGLMIYNYDEKCVNFFNASQWISLCSTEAPWTFQGTQGNKLKANNAGVSGLAGGHTWFGWDVDVDNVGDVVVVSTYRGGAGGAFVYRKNGNSWTQEMKLVPSDGEQSDWFGYSIAISGDGNTVVVGATQEDSDNTGIGNSENQAGAAYVYKYDGTNWNEVKKIKPNDITTLDAFGTDVDINNDGTTIVVTSPGEDSDHNGNDFLAPSSGAAYIFNYDGSDWIEGSKLKANDAELNDRFGSSISISKDGTTITVGSDEEDSNPTGVGNSITDAGAAYVYRKNGSNWDLETKLKADNASSSANFGGSVSVDEDGNTIVVGAVFANSSVSNSGSAYVYRFDGSVWTQQIRLESSDIEDGDKFGFAVSIDGTGNTIISGAHTEDSDQTGIGNTSARSGASYVYRFENGTWEEKNKLKPSDIDSDDRFGYSVSISNDGNTAIGASHYEDSDSTGVGNPASNSNYGAVYIYN